MPVDTAANRSMTRYSVGENARRIWWALALPLFRFSLRPCFAWRRFLLRVFGAEVDRNVNIYGSAVITMPWNLEIGEWSGVGEGALIYNLGRVKIGKRVTISQRAHLCAGTHDYRDPAMPLQKPPITIGDDVWICADAFIGPGVTVADRAIIAARAVVVRDVPAGQIVAGNPARVVKAREPFKYAE